MLENTNIKSRLDVVRSKSSKSTEQNLIDVRALLEKTNKSDQEIVNRIENSNGETPNQFDFDLLASENIYHISQIGRICIDYRLRFLDSKLYKGELPYEAITKIKSLESEHNITLDGFKMIAPSKLFKLENADDPLLFAPMGNGYYYFIHKWGSDLHPLRKLMMWPFKTFETLMATIFAVSLVLTYLFPKGFFMNQDSGAELFLLFLFMLKGVAGITLYYGFAKGKNFSTAIWRSKYFNA
jgi:hypothetical protein